MGAAEAAELEILAAPYLESILSSNSTNIYVLLLINCTCVKHMLHTPEEFNGSNVSEVLGDQSTIFPGHDESAP